MRKLIAIAAVIATIPITSSAAAAPMPERTLAALARHQTHGWLDDRHSLAHLEQRLGRGQRIYVTCGTISRLGLRAMTRLDVSARLVATLTSEPFNGYDDGHILLEVWLHGRWQVFDLDNNRQPLDRRGRGITISTFVRQRHHRYRLLAHDRAVNTSGFSRPAYSRYVMAHREWWYHHILGAAAIDQSGASGAGAYGFYAASARDRAHVLSLQTSWQPLGRAALTQLEHAAPAAEGG